MYPPEPQKLWTVEEFHTLQETGLLVGKYELIEGVIIDKMGQSGLHAQLICALMNLLGMIFGHNRMRSQLPIRIQNEAGGVTEPIPDVAVSKQIYQAYLQNPAPSDMLLVVEISDSSVRPDLTTKALLYAKAEISEYWVVDVDKRRVIVHRNPSDKGYLNIIERKHGGTVSPLAQPESRIAVADIFPQ